MIKAIVSDFSRVLLFPADKNYEGSLNTLNNELLAQNPDYDFWEYFVLNEELLEYYDSLTVPVFIFTSETIQDHPAVKQRLNSTFKGIFSAVKLGVRKTDPSAYARIAKKIQLSPEHILYIDDRPRHIRAAQAARYKTILYSSNKDVLGETI